MYSTEGFRGRRPQPGLHEARDEGEGQFLQQPPARAAEDGVVLRLGVVAVEDGEDHSRLGVVFDHGGSAGRDSGAARARAAT